MKFVAPWAGAFRLDTYVEQIPDGLSMHDWLYVRESILGSPFLGGTQLDGGFNGTLGFSVTFRRDNIQGVKDTFPTFAGYLDEVLLPDCNAFILNPLVVQHGTGVGLHVDGSLRHCSPSIGCPAVVSVFYAQVPEGMEGGQLLLYRRGAEVARITPRERTLLHFRGDLAHEVTPVIPVPGVEPSVRTARVSLVVEQYQVSPADYLKVPDYAFYSTALAKYL